MPSPTQAETSAAGSEPAVERRLKHHALAARTVGVTYRAAIHSAERQIGRQERTELTDRWQRWALETLDGYAEEIREVTAAAGIRAAEAQNGAVEACHRALDEAYAIVRSTPPDGS